MSAPKPWMKFYPQDWRADEKLRFCSLAARGLWMEMLALMHRSERYGQLLINGSVPTDAQLAVQAGAPPHEVTALLAELASAGVSSQAATGAIYSRRMTRDAKKARIARQNGKNGGNPSLCKDRDNTASDKGKLKGSDKPQRPEARVSDTDVSAARPPPDPVKALFDLGVSTLVAAGKTESAARSQIAKLRQAHGDAAVFDAIRAARDKTDPAAWLEATLSGQRGAAALYAAIDRTYDEPKRAVG